MVSSISFRANETTGGVGEKSSETAKQETTGGVGVRKNAESIFSVDNDLTQDTVSFKSNYREAAKESSLLETALGVTAVAALLLGTLGLLHKYDAVGKIKNEKVKDFFRHTDAVTEPCHKACKWIKNNSYDKIAAFINKKK